MKIFTVFKVIGSIIMLIWLAYIAVNFAKAQPPLDCMTSDGRIENMTIILDHLAFPPSETPRIVEAIGEDGVCYGSTVMQPETNTALAVWGEDEIEAGGIKIGDRLNVSLEYFPDAIIIITTAARDTTLSQIVDILVVQVTDLQVRADSLQGIVNSFPDQAAEVERLTRSLVVSDSLNLGFSNQIANAFEKLKALSSSLER